MGVLRMWREARGRVMRAEFEDLIVRIRGANGSAMSTFYNEVDQTIDDLRRDYGQASARERKAMLKDCRKGANQMHDTGYWPSALGLGISVLNVESEHVPQWQLLS